LRRARRLLIMGGALRFPGNITPAAEFNFYADPVAAQMVLGAGANTVLFPLDVTSSAIMSPAWVDSIGEIDSVCGQAAAGMLKAYSEMDPLLHDACPVAFLLDDSLFAGEPCHLQVDWRPGATEGHVLAWFGEQIDAAHQPNALAMTSVRNDALLGNWYAARSPRCHEHAYRRRSARIRHVAHRCRLGGAWICAARLRIHSRQGVAGPCVRRQPAAYRRAAHRVAAAVHGYGGRRPLRHRLRFGQRQLDTGDRRPLGRKSGALLHGALEL
jgi:hypothetical protein